MGKRVVNGIIREKLYINQESYDIETDKLILIGNEVSDNLFHSIIEGYNLDRLRNQRDKSGRKVILCLSGHDMKIKDHKGIVKYTFEQSGLVVRDAKVQGHIGGDNVRALLDHYSNCIPRVSQQMKRRMDKETRYQDIKDLVFCYAPGRQKITNNLSPNLGGIKRKILGRK